MTDFLPLTEGCRALILKGTATGREVTCLKFLGHSPISSKYKDCWELDTPVPWVSTNTGTQINLAAFPARYLMRIDGPPAGSIAAQDEQIRNNQNERETEEDKTDPLSV